MTSVLNATAIEIADISEALNTVLGRWDLFPLMQVVCSDLGFRLARLTLLARTLGEISGA